MKVKAITSDAKGELQPHILEQRPVHWALNSRERSSTTAVTMSIPRETGSKDANLAGSAPKSPTSGGFFGWMRPSPDSAPPAGNPLTKARSRRDSSSLTADEALNISRANARPLDVPRTLQETGQETGPSKPQDIPRSKPKYDKLGLIAAFSGGPGSF